jgi:RNA polymerase sigma-70 factor, ECF subfamily
MPVDPDVADDAELVRRAQRGDASAFGSLVARYQDRIYNVSFRLCRSREDAMDIVQTTFLRAFESLPRFEARAGFYTWIFRIAVNTAHSLGRRAGIRRTTSLSGLDIEASPRQAQPDEHEMIAALLAELDEEFRAAVVLKDIEGLDYSQIGEILGVPLGTVKSRIHRGRMLLREAITRREARDAVA